MKKLPLFIFDMINPGHYGVFEVLENSENLLYELFDETQTQQFLRTVCRESVQKHLLIDFRLSPCMPVAMAVDTINPMILKK